MLSLNRARRLIVSTNNFYRIQNFVRYNLTNTDNKNRLILFPTKLNTTRLFRTNKVRLSYESICGKFHDLDRNYKQQQRIYGNDLEALLAEVANEDLLNDDNSLLLLQCCTHLIPDVLPSKRVQFAEKAWQIFRDKQIVLGVEHYNAILNCYAENRMKFPYKKFLENMTCEPNNQTYNLLLECACENGDVEDGIEIINAMKQKGLPANEPVFNSLILGYLRNGDIKSVQNVLDTMRIAQIKLSSATYTALLRGYIETENINQFKNILETTSFREFNLKQLSFILQSVCLSENTNLLPLIKKKWAITDYSRAFETKITNLSIHLIHLQKPKLAYDLYKTFIEPEIGFITESDAYGSVFLQEMIKTNTPADTIITIVNDLIESNRNRLALFKATELALSLPNIKLALVLLEEMNNRGIKLRNHYFWPVLIHQARTFGEKGIFDIFQLMVNYNLKIEYETLEMYSLQYIQNTDADILIKRLKEFKLTVAEILTPYSVILLRLGKLKEVSDLIRKYKVKINASKLIKPLVAACVATSDFKNTINILKLLGKDNKTEDYAGQLISLLFTRSNDVNYTMIIELLKLYKTNGISISGPILDKLIYFTKNIKMQPIKTKLQELLNILESTNSSFIDTHIIPHPRDMNLEELECHLIELRQKKMETRGILRKLIQMNCRVGNVERVQELCEEFQTGGYKMTPGMKAGLLDLFIKSEQIENAWKIYTDLKENNSNFTVDEFKIIDLSRLLIQINKFEDALKILKSEGTIRTIKGGPTIERNCWNLLDSVAKTGNIIETQQLFKTIVSCNYCKETNIILGPLVRVHLCNDDLNGAVEEYTNCCIQYKKTPLVHELLCNLVQNEVNTELIQKVIEATSMVHGIPNAQMALVAALAESSLTKTLRKFFLETKVHLPPSLLENCCQRWVSEQKIDALKNLISSTRGLNIDLSVVYLNLMKLYSSNNDCDNALSLWNQMQDSDIIPTDQIKQILVSLLNNQKHPKVNSIY